jgi:FkbM family methyltransferase
MVGSFIVVAVCCCAVAVAEHAVRSSKSNSGASYKPLDIKSITPDGLLGDWRLVKSPTLDHRGQHYYFLSSDYDLVSKQMQTGTWENRLNVMFKSLWDSRDISERSMIVMDVGVNFGNFYMYAASQGCHMLGFEMQPKLYNIVEMSIRLSGYKSHSHLVNNAVWFNQLEMSFTPVEYGPKQTNLGYTHLLESGKGNIRINTTRIDAVLVNPKVGPCNCFALVLFMTISYCSHCSHVCVCR